jgi:hypothetical protein
LGIGGLRIGDRWIVDLGLGIEERIGDFRLGSWDWGLGIANPDCSRRRQRNRPRASLLIDQSSISNQSSIPNQSSILNQSSIFNQSALLNPQSSDRQSSIPQSTISDPQSAIGNLQSEL